jgi:hypothetical protein
MGLTVRKERFARDPVCLACGLPGGAPMNDSQPPIYRDQDARQGEIILRTRARRVIFLAGLGGGIILAFISLILAHAGHHLVG